MQIDLTQAESNNDSNEELGPLPEGRYNFIIDDTRFFKADSGTPMFEIRLSVIDGEYENRKAWRRFPLTPKAFVFVNELLQAVGSDLANKSISDEQLKNAVKNQRVSAYATVYEYKGKMYNDIKKFTEAKLSAAATLKSKQAAPAPAKESEEDSLFA